MLVTLPNLQNTRNLLDYLVTDTSYHSEEETGRRNRANMELFFLLLLKVLFEGDVFVMS
jgi:hypothetical protein